MKKLCLALLVMLLSTTALAAAESATEKKQGTPGNDPWIPVAADEQVLTMRDVPLDLMRRDPGKYQGMVFEDRFKFYHIYRDVEDADPARREQTILGETHFTARPIQQYFNVVRIRITPEQQQWIENKGIRRQDVVDARVRFAGIAPRGALAFELLEIQGSARSWRLRRTGD
jgi:hypothetical protein